MMNAPSGQEHVVKKNKFTEEQIAFALKQAELGTRVEEVCRKMGISEATFYVWKKRYGGVGPSELRRLRQLEEENRQAQADRGRSEPGQGHAAGGGRKKALRPSQRRELVPDLMQRFGCSQRQALRIVRMSASTYLYVSQRKDESVLKGSHQGDHRHARALWLPPGARDAASGGPYGQRQAGVSPVPRGRPVAATEAP